ncbi:MAG: hypothetical protein OXR73_13370 [Myxococcales bacterium]|nr:hypothetical protein [Myxococcales bacterium]
MHRRLTPIIWGLSALTLLTSTAHSDGNAYHRVPETESDALEMRTIEYQGGTNGRMIIEVHNRGETAQDFRAEGLFFVPAGNPEKSPQRLGAAGPFELMDGKQATGKPIHQVSVPAAQSLRLALHVFCIDSHRASPNSLTSFSAAKKRLPGKLRGKIDKETKAIMRRNGNRMSRRAKSDIQSHVWRTRNADWVKLEGERAQEKEPRGRPMNGTEQRHRRSTRKPSR